MKTKLAICAVCLCGILFLSTAMHGTSAKPRVRATITITSPTGGQSLYARTITVSGKVTGLAAGTTLKIVVTPIDGRDWVQDYPPKVTRDSKFGSIAYLGEGDLGVGEPFKIRVVGPGGVCSPTITVKRAK